MQKVPQCFMVWTSSTHACTYTCLNILQVIPANTSYHWTVTHPDGSRFMSITMVLQHTFTQCGIYEVGVIGTYPAGSFSKQILVTAECELLLSDSPKYSSPISNCESFITAKVTSALRLRSMASLPHNELMYLCTFYIVCGADH